jgi:hypothetical protein
MELRDKQVVGFLLLGIIVSLAYRSQAVSVDDLIESTASERIATGFKLPEGPVWHPDGYLLFSDILADRSISGHRMEK